MKIIKIPSQDGVANLQYCFFNGSQTEKDGRKGLLHLMEHLHYRDSSSDRVVRCKRSLEEIKATVNAYTSESCINFYTTCLPSDFPIAVEAMKQIVFEKNFNPSDLAVEAQVVNRELIDYYDDPSSLVHLSLEESIFDDSFVDTLGRSEDILSCTVDTLNEMYDDLFGLSNLVIFVTGPEEFLKSISVDSLYPESHSLRAVPRDLEVIKYGTQRASYKEIERGLQTVHLSIGSPIKNTLELVEDSVFARLSLQCASTMLGGTWESPLLKVLREEKGFCYSVGAVSYFGLNYDLFNIRALINPENKVESLAIVSDLMTTFHLDENLFNLAKAQLLKSMEWEVIKGSSLIARKISELSTGFKMPSYNYIDKEFTFDAFKSHIIRKDYFNPLKFSTVLCV